MPPQTSVFNASLIDGEALPFEINWTHEFANRWTANSAFAAASCVRPSSVALQTGLEYISSGGQSGPTEPQWPTSLGETVTDGSITWTAQALSNSSLRERIATDDWPDVANFTITPATPIDEPGRQLVSAKIASDVETAVRREIRVEVTTTEDNVYVGIIKMKVE